MCGVSRSRFVSDVHVSFLEVSERLLDIVDGSAPFIGRRCSWAIDIVIKVSESNVGLCTYHGDAPKRTYKYYIVEFL